MQQMLTLYGLERTIYRISISDYRNNFTLKGGVFLYAIFDGDFIRATSDIDLLGNNMNRNLKKVQSVFEHIFSMKVDDALKYDLKTIKITKITEFKDYHGVNISIFTYLNRTKIRVSIDIGFGDIIYPKRKLMDYPVLIDMEVPKLYVYSIESVIAEKFDAIVSLGHLNSRLKDFYDIYILARAYDFIGNDLKIAIVETFNHRGTKLDNIVAFENEFIEDSTRNKRWNSFVRKKKAMVIVDFSMAMDLIKRFLEPVVIAIVNDEEMTTTWNQNRKKWIETRLK
ncbi:putative nucleotidyltransferase component of viral defense system [Breznakia pachnodae]|uniref:Nucleotidyltransferase component of viral defense system n=2 Tax=Breznakia pachnodae TaxID=265178 RepID=A0ABU0E243_9FIRM|nr:putative nucleotidyltransferase component of viral defense system [Breznakia pachnodae]